MSHDASTSHDVEIAFPIHHWPSVVSAMRSYAVESHDTLLYLLAQQVEDAMDSHWEATPGSGCGSCNGEVSNCGTWDNAQTIMITWLMQKAGLS